MLMRHVTEQRIFNFLWGLKRVEQALASSWRYLFRCSTHIPRSLARSLPPSLIFSWQGLSAHIHLRATCLCANTNLSLQTPSGTCNVGHAPSALVTLLPAVFCRRASELCHIGTHQVLSKGKDRAQHKHLQTFALAVTLSLPHPSLSPSLPASFHLPLVVHALACAAQCPGAYTIAPVPPNPSSLTRNPF
jgi:hypothetical protein